MYIEIKIALNFFLSYLYDKLPRRRVNLFGEELEKYIGQKLTLANWPVTIQSNSSHTSTPPPPTASLNESHAITLNKQELYVDPFVISAATESALDLKEIVAQMPDYLKLFIEPGLVAYLLEPPNAESTMASQLPDLKILYKLPQIDLSTLTYISGNFKESSIYQNSVTHIAEDSASSTSGDLTATNSILNENLLQLLSAAATAANVGTNSSPNNGASAAPLQYFMQKLSLNEEQTSQVLSNLGQLSKQQQQQQPPKVANIGLGFPSAQFKPTLSPTDPIIQADYGSFNNRNAISPTGGTELWSSSSSCSSSSSSTGGSSSCLSMQHQPSASSSSLPTSSSSPSSKSVINNLDTTSPSLLLAVDGNVKKPPTAMSSQPANIPVMKPPSSLFTTAEFAQTKFGSTKSKNSYYAPNKPGGKSSSASAPQPHNPNHSQSSSSSSIAPQPLLSPQNSHSFHNPYHHAHHQQQKMNPEFSAYIKQKAAVQQLLKSSSVHPILGSPTSTLPTTNHLNGMMNKPAAQLSSHLTSDAYLDLNLITNHLNTTNLIYDMDNSSNTSSSCSSSSTGSLTSPQHAQQQNHQAQQHQLNLLLMNLLKANSSGFDYLNSSPLFAATSSIATANFNDHHTNFDSIVNSTIKEMIDGDLDEFDETTTEDAINKPLNSEFDENNNNNLAATNLIDDE